MKKLGKCVSKDVVQHLADIIKGRSIEMSEGIEYADIILGLVGCR